MSGLTEGISSPAPEETGKRSHQRCWEEKGRSQLGTLVHRTQRHALVTAAPARSWEGARPRAVCAAAPRFHLIPQSHTDPFLHVRKLSFKCIFHLGLPQTQCSFELEVG